jgi:hypothetical protein
MDEDKVETVRNWSREKMTLNVRLNNLFEVQEFRGFAITIDGLSLSILRKLNH